MPRRKKTPRLPLDLRMFETYLMFKLSASIRQAFQYWRIIRETLPESMPLPKPQRLQTRALKKLRKRNPVAWKQASKPAPRHP